MAQRYPGYLLAPMAAMLGVIAAVAELPLSFRHIDSTDAKSTFRALTSGRPTHLSINGRVIDEGAREMLGTEWRTQPPFVRP